MVLADKSEGGAEISVPAVQKITDSNAKLTFKKSSNANFPAKYFWQTRFSQNFLLLCFP